MVAGTVGRMPNSTSCCLVGAMTTRRIRAAVAMMLTRPYTTSTNVLTEEPGWSLLSSS